MTESESDRLVAEFTLDPHGASKQPEQLAALLEGAVRREFPEIAETVQVIRSADDGVVRLLALEPLDDQTTKKLAHRARAVYNDFMISPWY